MRSAFLLSSALSGLALFAPPPARAQTSDAGWEETADQGEDIAGQIIVTARRREETLVSTPVAVSVLDGASLDERLVNDVEDLLRILPSTTLVRGGPAYLNDISIRGQGGGRNGFSETATGLYRNGAYIAGGGYNGRAFSNLDLFDVERVEVLRGPQGALYGRNAVGGAINLISARPVDRFEVEGALDYSWSIERVDADAAVNLPLAPGAAIRVGGFYLDQDGGYFTNVNTGNKLDRQKQWGGRASALFTLGAVEAMAVVEHLDSTTPAFANLGYRARDFRNVVLDPDVRRRALTSESFVNLEQTNGFLHLASTPASPLTWRINASFINRDAARNDEDLDHFLGFQGAVLGGKEVVLFADQSEDFRKYGLDGFISNSGDGPFKWLIGLEYQNFDDTIVTVNRGVATPPGLRALFRDENSHEKLRSYAGYASLELRASDAVHLGVEGRVQRDEKDLRFLRTRNQADSASDEFDISLDRNWTVVLPAAFARVQLGADSSMFARVATGYRPGGFNTGVPPASLSFVPYDREYAISGELGYRMTIEGAGLLALSAYYTKTNDAQVVTTPAANSTLFILQNAPHTTAWGLEAELSKTFIIGAAGKLSLVGTAATNDGRFAQGTRVFDQGTSVDISDNRLNRTRDLILSWDVRLELPVGGAELFGQAGTQWGWGGFENATNTRRLTNFELLDLSAGVAFGPNRLTVYGKNLTDVLPLLQTVTSNEYYGTGRMIGIRFDRQF